MRRPAASVVLCTYTMRRWDDLGAAVHSVQGQSVRDAEIVVAIDHNPAMHDRVRRELPEVVAVANSRRPGLSGTRNAGLASSSGRVVAFLDDDCVAAPDWLERLVAHYAVPAVIGAGGAVLPGWDRARPGWFPEEFDWVVGCSYRGLPTDTAPVRNLIGASMSFRREVLEQLGGFREGMGRVGTLPLGCEETELCLRAQARWPATRLIYEPRARVRHRVPVDRARWRYFTSRCWAEGRSKAAVARLAGAGPGLASERAYTRRVLPGGVVVGMRDAVAGDSVGALRSASIVAGLATTTAGYAAGTLALAAGRAA